VRYARHIEISMIFGRMRMSQICSTLSCLVLFLVVLCGSLPHAHAKVCFTDRIACLEVCEDGSERMLTERSDDFKRCWPKSGPRRAHAERERKKRLLNLKVTNRMAGEVQFKLFSRANEGRQWPSTDKVWFLVGRDSLETEISCKPGEKICFGAWEAGERNYWGCGQACRSGCSGCCSTCGSSRITMRLDRSSMQVKTYWAMAIAWNSRGAWAIRFGDTLSEARKTARRDCSRSYGGCSVPNTYVSPDSFGCMAVARSRSNRLSVSVNGSSKKSVQRQVLNHCGRGCKVEYAECND